MFIPVRIRIMHLFGRTSFIIGFIFTIIGIAVISFFSLQINWRMYFAGEKDLVITTGTISGSQETRYSVNDEPLFNYNYRYYDQAENIHEGDFLEFEGQYSMGQAIEIKYLKKVPSNSRHAGKDRKNLDQIMFLGGIAALLAGLLFIVPSSRKTRRERKIIMAGLPAEGKLLEALPTNLHVNDQPVYNLTFEFTTGRKSKERCSVRSHLIRNFSDEHKEKLIYDPRKPSNAVVIDTLPSPVAKYILQKVYHTAI
jgi:hypothetical protein